MSLRLVPSIALVFWIVSAAVVSADAPRSPSVWHADFEIDPIAYALSGHSLHVGLGHGPWRLDLGNFAADVPAFLESDDAFRSSASGFGVKLQYFPFVDQKGLFVGVQGDFARTSVRERGSDLAASRFGVSTGLCAGLRIPLPAGLYISPWLVVSYAFGRDDVVLGDVRYDMSGAWEVLPFIHLGYHFF